MSTVATEPSPADWDSRELCPDEGCIGIIGESGRCTVCGRPGTGSPARPAAAPLTDADAADRDVEQAPAPADAAAGEPDDEFAERRLCPDDSCIGVLGPDGACKVCGARPAPSDSDGPAPSEHNPEAFPRLDR